MMGQFLRTDWVTQAPRYLPGSENESRVPNRLGTMTDEPSSCNETIAIEMKDTPKGVEAIRKQPEARPGVRALLPRAMKESGRGKSGGDCSAAGKATRFLCLIRITPKHKILKREVDHTQLPYCRAKIRARLCCGGQGRDMRQQKIMQCAIVGAALSTAIAIGCGGSLAENQITAPAPTLVDVCGTVQPTLKEQLAIETKMAAAKGAKAPGSVTIPVYVHVITTDLGEGDVSDATIANQLAILNTAYSGGQAPGGFNTSYRFTFVSTDRTANTAWWNSTANSADEIAMKTALRVGSADDLNIYIKNMEGTLGGRGGFPWNVGNLSQDGIIVRNTCMPGGTYSGYNLGDVAVHEVGHWLGLFHTYEGGCSTNNDYVSDTPASAAANYSCPVPGPDTCTGGKFKGSDPTMNFMNSTVNSCQYQFTSGQNSRMDTMWTTWRAGR